MGNPLSVPPLDRSGEANMNHRLDTYLYNLSACALSSAKCTHALAKASCGLSSVGNRYLSFKISTAFRGNRLSFVISISIFINSLHTHQGAVYHFCSSRSITFCWKHHIPLNFYVARVNHCSNGLVQLTWIGNFSKNFPLEYPKSDISSLF